MVTPVGLRLPFRLSARGVDGTPSAFGRLWAFAGLTLVLATSAVVALSVAPSAQAATCSSAAVAVTPMHSPDGTQRPFYSDDFGGGTTNHSGYVGYELTGAALGPDVWIKLSGFSGGALGLAANQSASIPVRATSQAGHPLVYAYLTASAITATPQTFTVEVWNGKPGQGGSTQVCTATDGFSSVTKVISAAANKITSVNVSNSSPAIGGSFDVSADGDTGTMGAGPSADQDSAGNGVFSMAPAMADSWPADAFTLTGTQVAFSSGTTYLDKLRVYPTLPAHTNSLTYTATYHFTVRNTTSAATAVYPVQNIASGTQVKYTGTYPGTISQISSPTITASLVKAATSISGPPYHVTYQVVVSNSSTSPVTLDYLRDSPTPTGPSNWTFDTGSAKLGGAPTADPALDSGTLVFRGPFAVPGSGSLTFTYTLSLLTTVTNSVVGTIGGIDLGATSGSGNAVVVDPSAPIVTTTTLPNATAGSSYSHAATASGGTGTYTWSVTAGSLPAGLSLSSATGTISGIPTSSGTSTFTLTATDATPKSGSKSITLTVDAAAGGGGTPADTTAPSGSVTLNGGDITTGSRAVSVGLAATDATGVVAYRVAEGTDCSAASWTAVTSTLSLSTTTPLTVSSGDGVKTVCAQFKDAAGNISTSSTDTITLDTLLPGVTLTSGAAATVTGAFTVTATFSESVSGFDVSDLTVGNGNASAFSGSGTTYSFTVTPMADGTVTVDVAAASASDAAGNGNTIATRLSRTADVTRPTVILSSTAASTTSTAFTVTATFSENVTGFDAADVSVGNGVVSALAGSGSTYTFVVTPTAAGSVTVDVAANSAADSAGNGNTAATQLTRTYDATAPTVTLAATATSPVNTAFTVTAVFSKSVTGFDASDVNVGNGSASAFSGSGTTYSFTVTPAADGFLTVDVAGGSATDSAGNGNTAATQLLRTADVTRPTPTLSSSAGSPINAAIVITATFSESVTGFDASDVVAGNGTVSGLAGSGSTYTFTVEPAADGPVTVDIAGGAATDGAGNASIAATQLTRTADLTAPVATLTTLASGPVNGAFTVTASFSENVTGFGLGDITVGNGSASALSGSGSSYAFTVTPTADGNVTVDLPAGGAHDAAGNDNTAATQLQVVNDVTPPTVVTMSGPAETTADAVAIFTFAADEATTFTCSLDGAAFAACSSPTVISGVGAGDHVFTIHATDAAGNTAVTTEVWTVNPRTSKNRVPRPDVLIIPMIDATDMAGRPQAFKQSTDAPHSSGPFTRKLGVKLRIPTPSGDDVQVDHVTISNFPDFRSAKRFPFAPDELYDWELLAGPSGDRPVYIRFEDTPDAPIGTATIVLDQELPTLTPKRMTQRAARSTTAIRSATAYGTISCGAAPRRWLRLPAADGFSGLNAVQIASNPAHPCGWRPYLPTMSYRLPGHVLYLRIEDRVGNISAWYRVKI
jgi:putative Ig domain-containing protein/Big-like domain-containing protein